MIYPEKAGGDEQYGVYTIPKIKLFFTVLLQVESLSRLFNLASLLTIYCSSIFYLIFNDEKGGPVIPPFLLFFLNGYFAKIRRGRQKPAEQEFVSDKIRNVHKKEKPPLLRRPKFLYCNLKTLTHTVFSLPLIDFDD